MVFQEPMTSLNPCFTIGFQIMESLKAHEKLGRSDGAAAGRSNCSNRSASRHRKAAVVVPAPAFGRHEPAGDDRHGDRLQSAPADRRRADYRPGRDDPEADPGPSARPSEGARHGADPDHPRHGRGRRNRATASPSCMRGRWWRRGQCATCSPPAAPLYGERCSTRCRNGRWASAGCRPSPASCPASETGRAAACSTRAAGSRRTSAAQSVRCSPMRAGPRAASIRCR